MSNSNLSKELVFLILQFFEEDGLKESAHKLQCETGVYFDMKFLEEMILDGNWEGAERYISGFTKLFDNRFSTKIYFEIRKQKFLEALDRDDQMNALGILRKELSVFAPSREGLFEQMTQLLTLNNIREHELLTEYTDAESVRKALMVELKTLIRLNPLFNGKLEFPDVKRGRLRYLINQSLNWQHKHCTSPLPTPDITSLFVDHVCPFGDNQLISTLNESNPLGYQTTPMQVTDSTLTNSETSGEVLCLPGATKPDASVVCQNKPVGNSNEEPPLKEIYQSYEPTCDLQIPKSVSRVLKEVGCPTSLDFHPIEQTILLVGTDKGHCRIWDVSSGEKLVSRNFKIWDISSLSKQFELAYNGGEYISISRVAWSPEGSLFGVACRKHIVQIYAYHKEGEVRELLEIEAHVGSVNDIAFAAPSGQLWVITCGDDKKIKVWDFTKRSKPIFTFEGHDAPVYSVCPWSRNNIHFMFSTSVDGKIKVWAFDDLGARGYFDAPGLACTSMAYSANDRLFSCGTNQEGESFLVEWGEREGSIKRTFKGLRKHSSNIIKFDTNNDQLLAAGDEHVIKIWGINKAELLTTIDADGDLPDNPCIRFNKGGELLAVVANNNRIKILATCFGHDQSVPISDHCSASTSSHMVSTIQNYDDSMTLEVEKAEFSDARKNWRLFEIRVPSQCKTLWLDSSMKTTEILRLVYDNAGNAIYALASNGNHIVWKWSVKERNLTGEATTEVPPQLWQPRKSSGPMRNDVAKIHPEEVVHCFTLSKNGSYLMSASGGKISIFNTFTFKTLLSIMPPPPVTTSLAFYPEDNNIAAIGRSDGTILAYNVRLGEGTTLNGHSKRVSGLAFSDTLNVLVSSGPDTQICVWDCKEWVVRRSTFLRNPDVKLPSFLSDVFLQFHNDQIHFLLVNDNCVAVYDARSLECIDQWNRGGDTSRINQAVFSCNSEMVYATFSCGSISVFKYLHLQLCCRILSSAYLPPNFSTNVYSISIAAHPHKPNQFSVGLSNGVVVVIEIPNNGSAGAVSKER